MRDLTVIAVDWSGARGDGPHRGIWVTAVRGDRVLIDRGWWSRAEAVDVVAKMEPPVIAGFDFSFGVPAWFARDLGCTTIDDVWSRAERDGERWLTPEPPFWRTRCALPSERRYRRCEERLRRDGHAPKSVFQLVGNGQVGAGSVRGMTHLTRLRSAGCAIWPFDGASERLVVEIYPTMLRERFPHLDAGRAPSPDARDARVSARAMAARAEELVQLRATTDSITRIEGEVWGGASAATERERSA